MLQAGGLRVARYRRTKFCFIGLCDLRRTKTPGRPRARVEISPCRFFPNRGQLFKIGPYMSKHAQKTYKTHKTRSANSLWLASNRTSKFQKSGQRSALRALKSKTWRARCATLLRSARCRARAPRADFFELSNFAPACWFSASPRENTHFPDKSARWVFIFRRPHAPATARHHGSPRHLIRAKIRGAARGRGWTAPNRKNATSRGPWVQSH